MSESISEIIPEYIGTFSLLILLLLVYLYGMIFYPYTLLVQSNAFLSQFGQNNDKVFQGEIYRLFTGIIIHANIVHLVSNLLFLLIFGIRLEEQKSSFHVIFVFFLSGLIGNLASLIWYFFSIPMISLGASGAIFGLLGGSYYILQKKSKYERKRSLYLLVLFFLITIGQDTNVVSHAFGFIGGFFTLRAEKSMKKRKISIKFS
ncbi:MAG: rhomboid family intramembrane serine protease [Candidatus Hodarchaeales archaeon]